MRRFTIASVAAVGRYVATFGLPMPDGCVAGAAPSPTCGGDLPPRLRLSAKTGIYGARYVTAEDVRTRTEAFNSCIRRGASGGGSSSPPATSTPARGGNGAVMPKRFTIKGEDFDGIVSGSTDECTARPDSSDPSTTKWISATLSGSTMTGTRTDHFVGPSVQGCVSTVDYFWPVTYQFKSDRTGYLRMEQGHNEQTLSGTCSGTFTETVEGFEGPVEWPPNE